MWCHIRDITAPLSLQHTVALHPPIANGCITIHDIDQRHTALGELAWFSRISLSVFVILLSTEILTLCLSLCPIFHLAISLYHTRFFSFFSYPEKPVYRPPLTLPCPCIPFSELPNSSQWPRPWTLKRAVLPPTPVRPAQTSSRPPS
jgi:hypothetical protein